MRFRTYCIGKCIAPYTNKKEVVRVLKQAVKNGENVMNQEQHIKDIHEMVGKHRIFD